MTSLNVLVVAPSRHLATSLVEWLTEAGCAVLLVDSFAAGKAHLEQRPSLLISEVRLGDYNGLHLALRAKAIGIPAIVLGNVDTVLQREAQRLGVTYISHELDRAHVVAMVRSLKQPTEPNVNASASEALAFISWDELAPPLGAREPSSSHRRRTLRS